MEEIAIQCPSCKNEVSALRSNCSVCGNKIERDSFLDLIEEKPKKTTLISGRYGKYLPLYLLGFIVLIGAIPFVFTNLLLPGFYYEFLINILIFFPLIFLIAIIFPIGYPRRISDDYIHENGKFDLETPRRYSALINGGIYELRVAKKKRLKEFAYLEGVVYIENSLGDTIKANLSDIKFDFQCYAGSNSSRFDFIISHKGNQMTITHVKYKLEKKEWNDMFNILLRGNYKYNNSTNGLQALQNDKKVTKALKRFNLRVI